MKITKNVDEFELQVKFWYPIVAVEQKILTDGVYTFIERQSSDPVTGLMFCTHSDLSSGASSVPFHFSFFTGSYGNKKSGGYHLKCIKRHSRENWSYSSFTLYE